MRNILFAIMIAAVPGSQVVAEPSAARKPDKPAISGKLVPVKRTGSGNACAASGPGFAKVDGTETCVKIGGAVGIGAGGSSGTR
jgi:hypothetical protein